MLFLKILQVFKQNSLMFVHNVLEMKKQKDYTFTATSVFKLLGANLRNRCHQIIITIKHSNSESMAESVQVQIPRDWDPFCSQLPLILNPFLLLFRELNYSVTTSRGISQIKVQYMLITQDKPSWCLSSPRLYLQEQP